MRKLFALMTIAGMLTFGASSIAFAQDDTYSEYSESAEVENTEEAAAVAEETAVEAEQAEEVAVDQAVAETETTKTFHQILKQKFIEGGPGFMGIILVCLILGLALAIERIIYLNLATTNTDKLLGEIEDALNNGGVESAKEVCRNTRGPVASIFYQGLDRMDEGVDMVEKSVVSYGSVQMGRLELGLSWVSLFIALAPMLGFMGTVIGMIQAFDDIAKMGDISPAIVADGIKVALLTTVFGLIVAIILQIFYNYIVSKIDSLVNAMEDASISLVDMVVKFNNKK